MATTVRLEGALLRTGAPLVGVTFAPYEQTKQFRVQSFSAVDQDDAIAAPGRVILAVQTAGAGADYVIFRDPAAVRLDSDTDQNLLMHSATLKVRFGASKPAASYPGRLDDLNGLDLRQLQWALMLKQAPGAAGNELRLFYIRHDGGGATPACSQLNCDAPADKGEELACMLNNC